MEPLSMRIPFSLLFVGWWTAGQRWMVTGERYPKPSVSVSPEVVTLGENVTVHCSSASSRGATFFLYKPDSSMPALSPKTAKDYEAEFIISTTTISVAGIYWCFYRFGYADDSHYSDDIHINLTDPSIPKPSIQVKPRRHQYDVHSNVTIECQGEGNALNFFLRKAKTGEVSQVSSRATAKATFGFHLVRMEDAGSYVCQYRRNSMLFVWSVPSDPVDLILKDPTLSKPSINVRPEGQHDVGTDITIECEGSENDLNFSLHKSRNLTVLQMMKATGKTASFSLSALRPEDAGNYTCQYCHRGNPFVCSAPSDPVQVIVTVFSSVVTIARLGVAGFILLTLGLIVAETVYSWRRGQL